MKNKVLFLVIFFLFITVPPVFANDQTISAVSSNLEKSDEKNTLILYYSKMGKTKILADEVRKLLPLAEFMEIKSDAGLMKAAIWNQMLNRDASIAEIDVDMSKYKKVILLSPIWFQKISSPARTAINTLSLSGKDVQLIITCGGYFGQGAQEKLKKHIQSKGSEVIDLSVVKTGGKTDEELRGIVRKLL